MPGLQVRAPMSDDGISSRSPVRVLVVDDSRAQRKVLGVHLARWGYHVTEAGSADEALALCRSDTFDIVLSDWVMPGLSGLEFCRAFRALPRDVYGYFILLTSKSDKTEVADGLDGGADDFLSKPINPEELRARMRAGERILGMQNELIEKNHLIGHTLGQLQSVYDSLDRDLIEARKVQQSLVRERHHRFTHGQATVLMRSSGHVGGDLAGFFEINPRRLALFSVDVSGHGVASAMMTARLAGLLSGGALDQNIALTVGAYGGREAWPPEMVAYRLNRLMMSDMPVDQYFTMAYAEVDMANGRVLLVQAGHPHPAILRRDGRVEFAGTGGLPIGLIADATYDRTVVQLDPGDRLLLVSDGVTECPSPRGDLGEEGLARLLQENSALSDPALFEALVWNLVAHFGSEDFPDDVSGVMFRYTGEVTMPG
jgi:sigma-B regulation protein RsbU (phosphoserine phosphatase)